MVSGAVQTPRLDLANEDLVRAHVHAVWLAETGLSLGTTLKEILDLSGHCPSLEFQDHVKASIYNENARMRAFQRAKEILKSMSNDLENADWYTFDWLETVINQVDSVFDAACERWRQIYRSARNQYEIQHRLAVDASRSKREKDMARRLAEEARSQINLLIEEKEAVFSDFYSYRYFATEGFLPGYNFPRLPLRAYIPGRKVKSKDEFLSRSRFLAISEFGPWATIYHEGSRYKINKVILPVSAEGEWSTGSAKCCTQCGYLHPMKTRADFDVCEMCGASLEQEYNQLFRLQNVSTQRYDRINSDEEERLRLGFEIKTGFKFTRREGVLLCRSAEVLLGDTLLVQMKYAAAATIWRINLGRRRQVKKGRTGFELDTETGYWVANEEEQDETGTNGVSLSGIRKTVIPYVEDHRNCLLFSLARVKDMDIAKVASLAAALKRAVQVEFQLEDNELAVEPLPDSNNRKQLLFYEAAEGGAGILRLLIDEPGALSRVAATALRLCHFDPISGENLEKEKTTDDACEAACYDCLMSYYNQGDHLILDRMLIKDFLMELKQAQVKNSPAPVSREQHMEQLLRMAGSELEKQWLRFLNENKLNLPTQAQKLIESCHTRPDFWYQEGGKKAAIYIDGPFHQYPERQKRDQEQEECLEDIGIRVIRFKHTDQWDEITAQYSDIFGT
jgi:very-short-patch-repair endonuclease